MSKRGIVLYVLGCEPSISYYKTARDILEGSIEPKNILSINSGITVFESANECGLTKC